MNKIFITQDKKTDYSVELLMAYEQVKKAEKNVQIITLNDLNIDYLINNSIKVAITNNLSPNWMYILKGLGIVIICIDRLEDNEDIVDIAIDYKNNKSPRYFTGETFSFRYNSNLDFVKIANLISLLIWDTDFFGFKVAYLSSMHLTNNILNHIKSFVKENDIKLVEYLCNCHDRRSVQIAESNGFSFTDIRLTFNVDLKTRNNVICPEYDYGKAKKEHIPELRNLSINMYKESRYYYDGNFETITLNSFYANWIEKAVLGQYDDECFCIFDKNKPIGFCSISYIESNIAEIGLFGIKEEFSGKGLGKKLLNLVFNTLIEKSIKKVTVVTQGRNYPAQRLYQSVGFRTLSTQLWYHKWV